jgi:hypothetical protein
MTRRGCATLACGRRSAARSRGARPFAPPWRREWTEQTGLILPEAAFQPRWRVLSPDAPRARIHVFTARADVAPGDIRLGEGAGFGFFTSGQARALPKPAHVVLAIDAHLAEA